jgi:meso-butanediol dehydrogenase/(S,S)-butanediol dehydrogenase/diacetyl reductase
LTRRFAGRAVAVTGAGRVRGLGAAIARRFAAEGASVMLSDAAANEMSAVADDLRGQGAEVATAICDVSRDEDCAAMVAATVAAFGRIDVMVNNAGIGNIMKSLLDTTPDDFERVIAVNLTGAFLCTRHAAAAMIGGGHGGRIINIASQAAKTGFPHMASYTASKHGMIGLTRSNAVELGQHGITVNAVCPNHVTTDLGAEQNAYFAKLLGFASVEAYLANMAAKNPMGRPGLRGDTAAACAFLASDDAGYITGEALNVSGGEEMH